MCLITNKGENLAQSTFQGELAHGGGLSGLMLLLKVDAAWTICVFQLMFEVNS